MFKKVVKFKLNERFGLSVERREQAVAELRGKMGLCLQRKVLGEAL